MLYPLHGEGRLSRGDRGEDDTSSIVRPNEERNEERNDRGGTIGEERTVRNDRGGTIGEERSVRNDRGGAISEDQGVSKARSRHRIIML